MNNKIDFAIRMHLKPTGLELLFERCLRAVVKDRAVIEPQRILYGYIVDFFIPVLGLAFEVDGPYHESLLARAKDQARDSHLYVRGIQVIRFTRRDLQRPILAIENSIRCMLNTRREHIKTNPFAQQSCQDNSATRSNPTP